MSVPNTFASATNSIPLANLDANFAYYDSAFSIASNIFTFIDTVKFQDLTTPSKVGQFDFSGITAATTVTYTFPNVTGALATIGNLAQTFAGTVKFTNTFQITDSTDITKIGQFSFAGITTGTTVTYTFPNLTGTLATLGNLSQTFTGSTTFAPATNSGTITIGGIPQTGTVTLGRSTAAQTIEIATGAIASGITKTVNIGANGASGSTTNISIGSAVSGALGTTVNNNNVTYAKLQATTAAAPTIASATTIAPTTQIVFISGTTAIATITAPAPISAGGGAITLIPTGIFTTTTAGNIALASTAVVGKALIMTYDATTTKWYPSY